MPKATSTIIVEVGDCGSRDKQLEQATSLLRERATICGILVTRVNFTTFEVTLNSDIPFGLTRETDLM